MSKSTVEIGQLKSRYCGCKDEYDMCKSHDSGPLDDWFKLPKIDPHWALVFLVFTILILVIKYGIPIAVISD